MAFFHLKENAAFGQRRLIIDALLSLEQRDDDERRGRRETRLFPPRDRRRRPFALFFFFHERLPRRTNGIIIIIIIIVIDRRDDTPRHPPFPRDERETRGLRESRQRRGVGLRGDSGVRTGENGRSFRAHGRDKVRFREEGLEHFV